MSLGVTHLLVPLEVRAGRDVWLPNAVHSWLIADCFWVRCSRPREYNIVSAAELGYKWTYTILPCTGPTSSLALYMLHI